MKLQIKNKFTSLRGSSVVKDENQNDICQVKGKFFSITKKKKILDANGNLQYIVRNKWFNFLLHSAYIYDANKNKVAKVKRKLSMKQNYIVEGYQDEIRVDGTFIGYSMEVYKDEILIGSIKRQINLVDSFILDVAEDKDAPFLIALVIAIDNIQDNASN
ncbi:MAG: LURP-one-related family protein [Corallococcus sp.]|nr:LURP-one-related family protein [Corallococcus sp.]